MNPRSVDSPLFGGGGGDGDASRSFQQPMYPVTDFIMNGGNPRWSSKVEHFRKALDDPRYGRDLTNVCNDFHRQFAGQTLMQARDRQDNACGMNPNGISWNREFYQSSGGRSDYHPTIEPGTSASERDLAELDDSNVPNDTELAFEEHTLFSYEADTMLLNDNGSHTSGPSATDVLQTSSTAIPLSYNYPDPDKLSSDEAQMSPYKFQDSPYLYATPAEYAAAAGGSVPFARPSYQSAPVNTYIYPPDNYTTFQSRDEVRMYGAMGESQSYGNHLDGLAEQGAFGGMGELMSAVGQSMQHDALVDGDYVEYLGTKAPTGEDVVVNQLGGEAEYPHSGMKYAKNDDHFCARHECSPTNAGNKKGKTSKKHLVTTGNTASTIPPDHKQSVSKKSKKPTGYGEKRADSGQKQEYVHEWELIKYREGYHPENKMALACFRKEMNPSAATQTNCKSKRRVRLLRSEWENICKGRGKIDKIAGRATKFSAARIQKGEENLQNHLDRLREELEYDHVRKIWVDRA